MSDIVLAKKINSEIFKEHIEKIIKKIGSKKVLIYGAGLAFEELDKKFDFQKLNIVAISDIKFKESGEFHGIKSIPPSEIKNSDFDVILMTLYFPTKAIKWLEDNSQIDENTDIQFIFEELISQEHEFIEYLETINTEKHLKKLSKKLKNKKVVIYGAGVFFQTIKEYYDLSKLNIIALSDRKFSQHEQDATFSDYKVCSPDEIKGLNPDYVLVATRFFINIIESLEETILRKTGIKIRPLIRKPFMELLKEIWC